MDQQIQNRNNKNFKTSVYSRVYEVQKMKDIKWLESRYNNISKYVKINKVYLETHRDTIIADDETLNRAKNFFREKGVSVSGGITYTVNESNRF